MRCLGSVVLALSIGGLSCGGGFDEVAAPKVKLPGPTHPEARCTLLGAGCMRNLDYQMCCLESVCTYTFSDGLAFASLDEALGYCTQGSVPDGATPLSPAEGGGFEPQDGTRDGVGPNGEPIDGSERSGGGSGSGGMSSSDNQSGAGGACYGSVRACQARGGPSDCRENPGCYYDFEGCFGTSWACQSFYSPSQCGYQLGCRWDSYYEQCVGGAASCGSRSSSGSCHGQRGCTWDEATCNGGAWQCNHYSTSSSCRGMAGCYWR